MDEIRSTMAAMKTVERDAPGAARHHDLQAATTLVTSVIWGGSALLLVLIVGAAGMSSRDFLAQRAQAWIRTGESDLGVRMQGGRGYAAAGRSRRRLPGGNTSRRVVAAVYFAPPGGELRRVGGYALPAQPDGEPRGRAHAPGRHREPVIETKDVPADFFPVSVGSGQGSARATWRSRPTTADGVPNGALELGSVCSPLSDHDRELLRRMGPS